MATVDAWMGVLDDHPWLALTLTAIVLTVSYYLYTVTFPEDKLSPAIAAAAHPDKAHLAAYRHLLSVVPDIVHDRQDPVFRQVLKGLYSAQAQSRIPSYIIRPTTTEAVSHTLAVLSSHVHTGVRFSVGNTGHSPNTGTCTRNGAFMIDMSTFNAIKLSEDRKTVAIQPGATWGNVYTTLDSHGLTCAGGRANSVGVGGLTIGGGLSWFSRKIGFVCDQVISFEIVLASGEVVNADDVTYPDLTRALRGGGTNFGVVTQITFPTFAQKEVWAGYGFHLSYSIPRMLSGLYDYVEADANQDTAVIIAIGIKYNIVVQVNSITHTKPIPNPADTTFLSTLPRVYNGLKIRTMGSATAAIGSLGTHGVCDLFATTTFENSLPLLNLAHQILLDMQPRLRKVKGINYAVTFQPLFPSATKHHAKNAMGINTDKSLVILLISAMWTRGEDNHIVEDVSREYIRLVEVMSKQLGLYHPYKYANYAMYDQEVFAGYGQEQLDMLRRTAIKYDPNGVFQFGCPGGFKLWSKEEFDEVHPARSVQRKTLA